MEEPTKQTALATQNVYCKQKLPSTLTDENKLQV